MRVVVTQRIREGIGLSTSDMIAVKEMECPFLPTVGMGLAAMLADGPQWESGPLSEVRLVRLVGDLGHEWVAECSVEDDCRRSKAEAEGWRPEPMGEIMDEYLDEGWDLVEDVR